MFFGPKVKSFTKTSTAPLGALALALFLAGCPSKNNPVSPDTPAAPTNTFTAVATGTPTSSPTRTSSSTPSFTPTSTWTPVTILVTATFTFTPTPSSTPTSTATLTPSSTPSGTPTDTPNYTSTPSGTPTSTGTSTWTATDTATSTETGTPTNTTTDTATSTATDTPTGTPTSTPAIGPTYAAAVTFGDSTTTANSDSLCVSGSNIWIVGGGGGGMLTEWAIPGLSPAATPSIAVSTFGPSYTFGQPYQVTVDPTNGNVYVAERGLGSTGRIDVFDNLGNYLTVFGGSLFTVTNAGAGAVAVNSSGTTVYALDSGNHQCYAWTITDNGNTSISPPSYTLVATFANSGAGAVGFGSGYMSWDNSGNLCLSLGGNVFNKYDYTGTYQQSVTLPGAQVLNQEVFDGSGNIFAVDTYGPGYVAEFNPAGAAVTHYTDNFVYPQGLAFDNTYNNLYIANATGTVVGFQKQ